MLALAIPSRDAKLTTSPTVVCAEASCEIINAPAAAAAAIFEANLLFLDCVFLVDVIVLSKLI